MKVLYLINSLILGGAESQLTKLILKAQAQGVDCALFVLETGGFFEPELDKKIPIYDGARPVATKGQLKKFLRLVRAWFLLLKVIFKEKPDVLHTHLPLCNLMGATAGLLMRVPFIITSRLSLGLYQDRHPLWKKLRVDRLINQLSDRVIVNSQAVWDDVILRDKINPEKLVLIPNGLDTAAFDITLEERAQMRRSLGLDDDTLGIIMVGNLRACKGHAVVLQALPQVMKAHKNFIFYFAGADLGIQAQLQQLSDTLGLTKHVVFLGGRGDIPMLLGAMDMFVMASFEEGSSNALLEAMAAGLPILTTDVGGNREGLDNGQAGLLIPPGNSDALAHALLTLFNDKKQRDQLGQLAKNSVCARYSIEKLVRAHIDLYAHAT